VSARSKVVRVSGALAAILAVGSPLVLYYAVRRGRAYEGALLLLAYAVLRAIPMVLAANAQQRRLAMRLPLIAVVSAILGVVLDAPRALLLLPSASQLAFAATFLASLRSTPLVEHFARMKHGELAPRQIAYCRTVTKVWAVVLAASAAVSLALAAFASLEAWTWYTSIGIYVVLATTYGIEYAVRRLRSLDTPPAER
jgi:uncharacterized membrane protein